MDIFGSFDSSKNVDFFLKFKKQQRKSEQKSLHSIQLNYCYIWSKNDCKFGKIRVWVWY